MFADLIQHDATVTSTIAVYARMMQMLPVVDASEIALLDKSSTDHYRDATAWGARHATDPEMVVSQQAVKSTMILEAAFRRAGSRLVVGNTAGNDRPPRCCEEQLT